MKEWFLSIFGLSIGVYFIFSEQVNMGLVDELGVPIYYDEVSIFGYKQDKNYQYLDSMLYLGFDTVSARTKKQALKKYIKRWN